MAPRARASSSVFWLNSSRLSRGAGLQFFGGRIVETVDSQKFFQLNKGHFFQRREAFGHQQLRDHFVDIHGVLEHLGTFLELGLTTFRFFGLRHDVDVPAGQLRRQTHVLSATANGLRQLFIGHDNFDALGIFVHDDLGHLSRLQRVDDEGRGFVIPGNDIDLFALQFVHNGLHARTAHTDTGTDRVDRVIVGDHADLGTAAGVTGDGLHFDDAVVNLRYFLSEQLGHELGRGTGQEDLRATGFRAYIADVTADAVAVAERFARDQLIAAHDGFGPAQVHDHVAVFGTLDDAVDDFADAVLEFFVLTLALGIADLLDDHLFGGLSGDAAKVHRRQRVSHVVADVGFRVLDPGPLRQRFR